MKTLIVMPLLSLVLFVSAGPAHDGGIEWSADYSAALEKAKASGKPILLYFTASW